MTLVALMCKGRLFGWSKHADIEVDYVTPSAKVSVYGIDFAGDFAESGLRSRMYGDGDDTIDVVAYVADSVVFLRTRVMSMVSSVDRLWTRQWTIELLATEPPRFQASAAQAPKRWDLEQTWWEVREASPGLAAPRYSDRDDAVGRLRYLRDRDSSAVVRLVKVTRRTRRRRGG